MNILGLIPARGGSKGIPNKNIVEVAGKPLIAYSIEAALGSKYISRTIISTDSLEIARISGEYGGEVPFMRPSELARDETPSLPVARHAVEWLQTNEDWKPDVLVLLQPTSPLRTNQHIDAALEVMMENDSDSTVSVVEVPHNFHPYKIMEINNKYLIDHMPDSERKRLPRQKLPTLYARNGPAILAVKTNVLESENGFYGQRVIPFIMDRETSIDIDDAFDLLLAELLIRKKQQ